jgi:hypothetical protein
MVHVFLTTTIGRRVVTNDIDLAKIVSYVTTLAAQQGDTAPGRRGDPARTPPVAAAWNRATAERGGLGTTVTP